MELDTNNEEDNRGKRSGTVYLAAMILDRPPPEKAMYGKFRLKLPYPASLRSEPRSDFPNQLLPSSLPLIDKIALGGVLGLSRKHHAHIGGPFAT
jgi:hypothetical protein